MGQNASDLARRRPAHRACAVSTSPLRSWGGLGEGGWADPLAHIEVRPGGKAFWPPRCPQGSEWNPGSLPRRLGVYLVKAMSSRC